MLTSRGIVQDRRMARGVVALSMLLTPVPASVAGTPMTLDCTGPFAKNADEAAVVARFGRANVVAAALDGAEGSTEHGTVVFPKDPARRIEILWQDAAHRRQPASIMLRGRTRWAVLPTGAAAVPIGIGTSVAMVEAANGRPFTLTGFGWDMGGYAGGWRGGALELFPGGCSLSLRFDPDPQAKSGPLDKVSGDRRFSSAAAALRAVSPTVSQISLDWPE